MLSKHVLKKFNDYFSEPQDFWTSEDGMMTAIVAKRSETAIEDIKKAYEYKNMDWNKVVFYDAFVEYRWMDAEYFDGYSGQNKGKGFYVTDEDTGMPVTVCDLYP